MKQFILIVGILVFYSSIVSAKTDLTLSPSLIYFDYAEFNTIDKQLNNETGWLPGVSASVGYSVDSSWSLGIFTAYYDGTVDYDGQTQTGSPHETDTGTRFIRVGLRIGRVLTPELGVFILGQSHEWQRNIYDNNNVSGVSETYEWMEYAAGIAYYKNLNSRNTITTEASLILVRNADIYVDLSRIDYGTTDLDIGDGTGGRLNIEWNRQHDESSRYGVGVFLEGWDFGRSNTRPTSGGSSSLIVTEPRSETRNIGLKFNIKYMF